MASKRKVASEFVLHHKDGSLWAKGQKLGEVMVGYWEWFRKDGTKLRSGSFEAGEQVGEWTTYGNDGRPLKVTVMKSKAARSNAKGTSAKPSRGVASPSKRKVTASASRRAQKPSDRTVFDDYLDKLPTAHRDALQDLRELIHAAAKGAEECISYGVPAFRLDGRVLVYFGAAAKHCSLYPGSGRAIDAHRDELADFEVKKGTIRFAPDRPLPKALVRKLVKFRMAENGAD